MYKPLNEWEELRRGRGRSGKSGEEEEEGEMEGQRI
jgi:hypothetical protein